MSIQYVYKKSDLRKLDNSKLYTLSNRDEDQIIEQKTVFTEHQDEGAQHHGASAKVFHGSGATKPAGVYLAHGRSWIDFAYDTGRTHMFNKRYLYKVTLSEELESNLIHLDSHKKAIEFTEKYSMGTNSDGTVTKIDWGRVAKDGVQGVSVIPWIKSDNLKLTWYNDFESPQIAIWKADAGDLTYELEADATEAGSNLYLSPDSETSSLFLNKSNVKKYGTMGGKKKRRKTKRRRKKRTKRNTSRRARYSRRRRSRK